VKFADPPHRYAGGGERKIAPRERYFIFNVSPLSGERYEPKILLKINAFGAIT
jgi:hypothetical protein